MCTPLVVGAMAALSVAESASQYVSQEATANAQQKQNALQTQYDQQARVQQTQQAQQQEEYHNQSAYQLLQQNAWQTRAAQATALTSAGDNGVDTSSLSVGALQQEYMERNGQFDEDVQYNRQADTNTLQDQIQGFGTQEASEDNSERAPVYPSAAGLGLGIGSGVLNAYSKFGNG